MPWIQEIYYLGNRFEGTDHSELKTKWRYGCGNVHPATESEKKNATANIIEILKQNYRFPTQTAVMLVSQYGSDIHIVDDDFLKDKTPDENGIITIKGDGLFTTKSSIPLLNKSGDAHAVLFESKKAVGIAVGSWRCIKEGIMEEMLQCFSQANINPDEITIHIGPGLGSDSYSFGQECYEGILEKNQAYEKAFTLKQNSTPEKPKYILDFPKLINIFAEHHGIEEVIQREGNTFDKTKWKKVKERATNENNPETLKEYYGKQTFFGARLYTRVDRQIRHICENSGKPLPEGMEENKASYNGTGRCLNGIMI